MSPTLTPLLPLRNYGTITCTIYIVIAIVLFVFYRSFIYFCSLGRFVRFVCLFAILFTVTGLYSLSMM